MQIGIHPNLSNWSISSTITARLTCDKAFLCSLRYLAFGPYLFRKTFSRQYAIHCSRPFQAYLGESLSLCRDVVERTWMLHSPRATVSADRNQESLVISRLLIFGILNLKWYESISRLAWSPKSGYHCLFGLGSIIVIMWNEIRSRFRQGGCC